MADNSRIGRPPSYSQHPPQSVAPMTFAAYKAATTVKGERRDKTVQTIDSLVEDHLAHPANKAKWEKLFYTVLGDVSAGRKPTSPGLMATLEAHAPMRAALIKAQLSAMVTQANQRFFPQPAQARGQVERQHKSSGSGGSGRSRGDNTIIIVDTNGNQRSNGGSGSGNGGGSGGSGS